MSKKQDSEPIELKSFNSVLKRIEVETFYFENNLIFAKPVKENFLLVFQLDSELKKQVQFNFTDTKGDQNLLTRINFLSKAVLSDQWTQISQEAEIYLSKVFPIEVKDFTYNLIINRDQMPFKLLKAEYDSIFFTVKDNILLIKKRFNSKKENCGFSIIRGFQCL